MPSSEYYRRQSELCLQLALLHDDAQAAYRLVELAKDLQAKAEGAESGLPLHDACERAAGGQRDRSRLSMIPAR